MMFHDSHIQLLRVSPVSNSFHPNCCPSLTVESLYKRKVNFSEAACQCFRWLSFPRNGMYFASRKERNADEAILRVDAPHFCGENTYGEDHLDVFVGSSGDRSSDSRQ